MTRLSTMLAVMATSALQLAVAIAPVAAAEPEPSLGSFLADSLTPAPATLGTLLAGPSSTWAKPLEDEEMAELRGGFAGIEFSVLFTGSVERNGTGAGELLVNAPSVANQPPSPTQINNAGDGQVTIITEIGQFAGASGIFQIAQVPGNFNVVNNNLIMQVNIVQEPGLIPDLSTLIGGLP